MFLPAYGQSVTSNHGKEYWFVTIRGLEAGTVVTDKTQSVYESVIKSHSAAAYVFYHQPSIWVWIGSDGNDHVSKLLLFVKRGVGNSVLDVCAVLLCTTRWVSSVRISVFKRVGMGWGGVGFVCFVSIVLRDTYVPQTAHFSYLVFVIFL